MTQITEAQLFEMMGRLFAELRALNAENEQLRLSVAQLEGQLQPKGAPEATEEPKVVEID